MLTQKEKDKIRNRQYSLLNKERIDNKSRKHYIEKIMFLKLERGGNKSKTIEDLRKESDKCELLCPNCHYEITYPE